MNRKVTSVVASLLVVFAQTAPLFAYYRGGRGSVSAASSGSYSRSGNTSSWQGGGGYASGSRTVSQTGSGYNVNRQVETQSGASKDVNRDVDTQDRSVERSSTATNAYGQTANRDRTTTNQGGYATVQGNASTSTGRAASGQGTVGRNIYGQPTAAGSVNTRYSGSYAGVATRNPYGGWSSATVGPYGGKVTTTLPSGYRTTSYYGRSYYSYGGAYYRPYTYGGMHYYYPVPPPYYAYYDQPPVGAMILMVAGVSYLVSQQGSYSKQTTTSEGTVAYQTVPAPVGAALRTLPAERVLVTVSGATYYLYANTFYRRVVQGAEEQFVVVSPPAGVVFIPALPADFDVVQLNSMYFASGGNYYVTYLSTDGKELYALVDPPPQPPATAATAPVTAAAPPPGAPAPAIQSVAQTTIVPTGTLVLVRFQTSISSITAVQGDRFMAFLDEDLVANGRLIAARGGRVYGVVTAVGADKSSVSVELTDVQAGSQVVPITTAPLTGQGIIPAQTLQSFAVVQPFQVDSMTNVAVR
jgi:Family of unknown function (DUF6515)